MEENDSRRRSEYERSSAAIIEQIKGLGPECRTSGDDSGLDDVWQEFKSQVQEQESIFFEAYEHTIRGFCDIAVKDLPVDTLKLLWICTNAWVEHEDDENASPGEMRAGISDALYDEVCTVAADEQMQDEEAAEDDDFDENEEEDDEDEVGEDASARDDQPQKPDAPPPAIAALPQETKLHNIGTRKLEVSGQPQLEFD